MCVFVYMARFDLVGRVNVYGDENGVRMIPAEVRVVAVFWDCVWLG